MGASPTWTTNMKKLKLIVILIGMTILSGCATSGPPEPVVYYGWYGSYYGPYYWDGPVIVYGTPYRYHGYYWHSPGHQPGPGHGPLPYRPSVPRPPMPTNPRTR